MGKPHAWRSLNGTLPCATSPAGGGCKPPALWLSSISSEKSSAGDPFLCLRGPCAPAWLCWVPQTSAQPLRPQPREAVPCGQQSPRRPVGLNIPGSRAEDEAAGCVPLPCQGQVDSAHCLLPSLPGGHRECAGWREGAQPPPFFSGPGTGMTYHLLQGPTGASSSRRAAGKGLFGLG